MARSRSNARSGEDKGTAAAKIQERVADLRFALDRLGEVKSAGDAIGRHLDLGRIGIMGHSNGGIAAVEACGADSRFGGCLYIDGQMAGGPFSFNADGGAPDQPFMYLTKEALLHPALAGRFEAGGPGTYRVDVTAAAHDHFADGALFKPTLNPVRPDIRRRDLRRPGIKPVVRRPRPFGGSQMARGKLAAPTDVYVNVYPLGGRPSIPTTSRIARPNLRSVAPTGIDVYWAKIAPR